MDYEPHAGADGARADAQLPRARRPGGFAPLGTRAAAEPGGLVNFITGLDPGGHGIFDFIHRDPTTMMPYLSTARTEPPAALLKLGKWQIPLAAGRVELLRQGRPSGTRSRSAASTPRSCACRRTSRRPARATRGAERHGHARPARHLRDVLLLHDRSVRLAGPVAAGAGLHRGGASTASVEGTLYGPANPFLVGDEKITAALHRLHRSDEPVREDRRGRRGAGARGRRVERLGADQPSTLPTQSVPRHCRFYLKAVRPGLRALRQPDEPRPLAPAMPVSTPGSFAAELARATGRFYTQGMPEDTKALRTGVCTRRGVPPAGANRRRRGRAAVRATCSIASRTGCSSTTSAAGTRCPT